MIMSPWERDPRGVSSTHSTVSGAATFPVGHPVAALGTIVSYSGKNPFFDENLKDFPSFWFFRLKIVSEEGSFFFEEEGPFFPVKSSGTV